MMHKCTKKLLGSDTLNRNYRKKTFFCQLPTQLILDVLFFRSFTIFTPILNWFVRTKFHLGDKVYLNVPSGNFGNALGGYYAKDGLPVEKILIASNNNNILTQLIKTGSYDLTRKSVIANHITCNGYFKIIEH